MKRKLFEDFVSEISSAMIEDQYIKLNKSYTECAKIFGITTSMFMRLLKYYNISKPKDLHTANIKASKLERFGDENYNNPAKRTATNIEKYGVANQFQRKELFPQIAQTKTDKYGSYNNIDKNMQTRAAHYGSVEASYEAQQETYKATCMAKYGVTNAAQIEAVKAKIKESVETTFEARYGIKNYWCSPDAKRSNGSKNSQINTLFASKLTDAGINFEREVVIDDKIFDFKVNNYVIELNPTATHNSTWSIFDKNSNGLDRLYHKLKSETANKNNLTCIHIFDWDSQDKIIEQLKKPSKFIGARQCEVKEISATDAATFLNTHHLQGYAKDKIRLGLFYESNLVSVMTFGTPRFNKNYEYELIRYCTSDIGIIGGAEKLFKYFITKFSPTSIISYCDISKFTGQIYNKLGFRKIYTSGPSLHWYNLKTKQHILDSLLRIYGFDKLFKTSYGKGTSNEALMLEAGFVKVYDCGQTTYGWESTAKAVSS